MLMLHLTDTYNVGPKYYLKHFWQDEAIYLVTLRMIKQLTHLIIKEQYNSTINRIMWTVENRS